MELIGMTLFAMTAGGLAAAAAAAAMVFRSSRRFALAILATPPVAVILLFLCGWSILDSGPVCGPDPEWDRCPSWQARTLGWSLCAVAILLTAWGASLAQKVLEAAISLWFHRTPTRIFQEGRKDDGRDSGRPA